MALTRKFLAALGIEDDKVDEIIQAHTETVNGLKDEIEKYKADAEKLPEVTKERDKLKEAADASDGKNPYKVKYDALKEEYAEYKKGVDAKESKAKKDSAYKALLKEAGVSDKRIEAVLKVSDVDGLEFDEEGKVKNHDDLIKSIKEDWSDFIVSEGKDGAKTPTPPAGSGKTYKTKEEIYAIKDTAERQKAIADNHELFGFLVRRRALLFYAWIKYIFRLTEPCGNGFFFRAKIAVTLKMIEFDFRVIRPVRTMVYMFPLVPH